MLAKQRAVFLRLHRTLADPRETLVVLSTWPHDHNVESSWTRRERSANPERQQSLELRIGVVHLDFLTVKELGHSTNNLIFKMRGFQTS